MYPNPQGFNMQMPNTPSNAAQNYMSLQNMPMQNAPGNAVYGSNMYNMPNQGNAASFANMPTPNAQGNAVQFGYTPMPKAPGNAVPVGNMPMPNTQGNAAHYGLNAPMPNTPGNAAQFNDGMQGHAVYQGQGHQGYFQEQELVEPQGHFDQGHFGQGHFDQGHDDFFIRRPNNRRQNGQGHDQGQGQGRPRVDSLPKSLKYSGDTDWNAFYIKFMRFSEMRNWTPVEAKDYLCFALEGKASEFFATILDRDIGIGYHEIIQKLEKRFGSKEIPQTAQVKLLTLRQGAEQSIEDWADQVLQLASKAYKELPENYMYEQAISRICHGCKDRDAGQYVVNLGLRTIEDVVDKIKSYQYNKQAMTDYSRKEVKEVRCAYSDDSDDEGEGHASLRLSRSDKWGKRDTYNSRNLSGQGHGHSFSRSTSQGQGHMEKRVGQVEGEVGELKSDIKAIRRLLESLSSVGSRTTSPSPARARSPSPRRDECYHCGGQGHYKSECPLLLGANNKPAKKVSFQENEQGLRK